MEKKAIGVSNERQITLKLCGQFLSVRACVICGAPCTPAADRYFYYSVIGTDEAICDSCAEKHDPKIVEIRKEAIVLVHLEVFRQLTDIRNEIEHVIRAQFEDRYTKYLNHLFPNMESL